MTTTDRLVNRSEAAVALGVSSATISRWIKLGMLDVVRVGPMRTYITAASIRDVKSGKRNVPNPPVGRR